MSCFVNVKHWCLLLLKITKLVLMIFHQWWETSTSYKDSIVTASQPVIINWTTRTGEEIQLSGMHYHIPRLLYYHVSGCTFPWASGMACLTSSVPVNWRGAGTENWITMDQEVRHHSLVVSSILDVNQVGRELKLSRKHLRDHFQAKFSCSAGLVAVETYNGIFQHTRTVGIQDKT